MLIELLPPYSNDWKKGYLQTLPTGRKNITLFNSNEDRSVTSYARYLMATHLGRYLKDDEYVDHIDEDRTNDSLDNLQILTDSDNVKKSNAHRKANRVPKHGTLSEYRYCKCDLCKQAKKDYMAKYNKDKR